MEKLSIDNAFKQSNKRSRKKLVNFAQPKDVKEFLKNKKEPENNPEIEKTVGKNFLNGFKEFKQREKRA